MKGIITEREYNEYEAERLKGYAQRLKAILRTVPIYEISKGTGLKWDTVNKMRKGEAISFRALCRIERYLLSIGFEL